MIYLVHSVTQIAQAADGLRANLMEQRGQYKDTEIPDWLRDSLSFSYTIICCIASLSKGIDEVLQLLTEKD